MPVYRCRLGDEKGRTVERDIEADNAESLRETLEREGWIVYRMSRKTPGLPPLPALPGGGRVRISEFLVFNQELAALLKAGLPLVTTLETLADKEENRHFRTLLNRVVRDVKEGKPLSDAMEGKSPLFTRLYISSIRAGERSGEIVTNVQRYIDHTKRVEDLKKRIISASTYPLILLSVAVGVILFLLLYVVPTFSRVFLDAGAPLPGPTRFLISLTDTMRDNAALTIILVLLLISAFLASRKTSAGRRLLDRLKISAPWLGETIAKYAIAKFSRTLSTILRSGTPLVSALALSAGTLNNIYLEEKVRSVSKMVEEGADLAGAMEKTGLMPPMALKMIVVGESSGALDSMFENVADLFEEEVDRRLGFITTSIEPILMLAMGLIIAFIVVAMYLPIFRLAGAVR